jgi:hypothetical protein
MPSDSLPSSPFSLFILYSRAFLFDFSIVPMVSFVVFPVHLLKLLFDSSIIGTSIVLGLVDYFGSLPPGSRQEYYFT